MSNLIERRGKVNRIKTFLDEKDIHGGDSIPESIRAKIRECHEFVVLLSRYSIDRQWVLVEVGAAWGLKAHCGYYRQDHARRDAGNHKITQSTRSQ